MVYPEEQSYFVTPMQESEDDDEESDEEWVVEEWGEEVRNIFEILEEWLMYLLLLLKNVSTCKNIIKISSPFSHPNLDKKTI